jgi:hypothetical protein
MNPPSGKITGTHLNIIRSRIRKNLDEAQENNFL